MKANKFKNEVIKTENEEVERICDKIADALSIRLEAKASLKTNHGHDGGKPGNFFNCDTYCSTYIGWFREDICKKVAKIAKENGYYYHIRQSVQGNAFEYVFTNKP